MSEIPEDIDQIASDIVRVDYSKGDLEPDWLLYKAIANAILAERERSAKIAEEVGIYWDSLRGYEREACFKVADAIRGTSPS